MTQRDLFDALGRLPESYRLEALEQPETDAADEINTLFTQDMRQHTGESQPAAAPKEQTRSAERGSVFSQTAPHIRKEQNPIRNVTIGLTAIAAVIALTVGAVIWRVNQETIETIGSPAASSGQSAVTEMQTQTDAAGEPVTETTTTAAVQANDEAVTTAVPQAEQEESVHTAETNIFGGKGALRIIGIQLYMPEPILEDEEYWYLGGKGRVSKTETDAQGKYCEELLCQTPGCLHQSPECLYYRYQSLLTDGEALYLPYDHGHIEFNGVGSGELVRLLPDGTEEDFFVIDMYEILTGFRNAGNSADANDYKRIYIYDLQKLGDSGNYLIHGQLQHEDIGSLSIDFNVIYTPETHQKIFLPWEKYDWQYDVQSGQLFGCYAADEYAASKGFTRDAQFGLYDIHTGECIKESGIIPNMFEAVMQDGTVYFIRKKESEQKFIVDGEERGGRLVQTDSLCTYDFETGKQTVLQEEIDFSQIELCGGRLLCKRSARVGKDQLFFLNPADMSEEVLFETPNKIPVLYCCTNPDFLLVQGEYGAEGFIVDGELKRFDFKLF